MRIKNLILGVNSVIMVSCLIRYDSLLQNATYIIAECGNYFITQCDRSLLQNASGFLLKNATVLLQNATVITNFDDLVIKCDSYYKMQRLLQIATVQRAMMAAGMMHIAKKCMKRLLNEHYKENLIICSKNPGKDDFISFMIWQLI